MALPLTLLPSLLMNRRTKIGLAFVFSLALIIIAFAAVRMTQVLNGPRQTPDLIGLAVWSVTEASTAVIVGSLPPLKSFLSRKDRKKAERQQQEEPQEQRRSRRGPWSHLFGTTGLGTMASQAPNMESTPSEEERKTGQDVGVQVENDFDVESNGKSSPQVGEAERAGRNDSNV